MTTSIRFNNDLERKNYERGIAIVKAKLKTCRADHPTLEMQRAKTLLEGRVQVAVTKQFAALIKAGLPPVPARAASTITAKAPTRPTAPVEPARKNYTLHRYACKNWLPTLA